VLHVAHKHWRRQLLAAAGVAAHRLLFSVAILLN
jgi:hypothetical protein